MNKIKYAFGALLSMMLLFSACSRADEPQQLSVTEPTEEVKMREVEVEFTLDVEGVEQLRAMYQKVEADGKLKTFLDDEEQNVTLSFHAYTYVPSTDGVGIPFQNSANTEILVKKLPKRNEAFYSGPVADISTQTYKVKVPVEENGQVSYLAVRLRTKDWPNRRGRNNIVVADKDGYIPFSLDVFSTDPIEIPSESGQPYVLPRLRLKPRGTFLAIHLKNDTDQPAQVRSLQFFSNVIHFPDQYEQPYETYTYGLSELQTYKVSVPEIPTVVRDFPGGGVTVEPNTTKTCYLWGIPIEGVNFIGPQFVSIPATIIRALGPNSEPYSMFYSENKVTEGVANVTLRLSPQKALTPAEAFPGGHMPLAYMAEADMADVNAISSTGSSALLYLRDLGTDPNTGVSINQPGAADLGYYLPSSAQMTAAFMPLTYQEIYSDGPSSTHFGREISPLSPYGLKGNYFYQMDKYATGYHSAICVLRFIGNGNKQLTAYRYTYNGSRLTIQARYLGPTFSGGLKDISKDEFWSEPHPYEVVRRLNVYPHDSYQENAYFLLSDRNALRAQRPHYSEDTELTLTHYTGYADRGRVRLFMRNPPQN